MLSEQENHRLAEIEFHLRVTDPRFAVKMSRIAAGQAARRPWVLRWLGPR
jgi:hypothetical protein